MTTRVVIPARYASSRLPGKPLLEIAGQPMLQHVYERVQHSGASEVIVATDDARIADAARGFNADICMTSTAHRSGTERLGEVVEQAGWDDDTIVVNVQGDEPMLPTVLVRQVADGLAGHADAMVATLAYPLESLAEAADDAPATTEESVIVELVIEAPPTVEPSAALIVPWTPLPTRCLSLAAFDRHTKLREGSKRRLSRSF